MAVLNYPKCFNLAFKKNENMSNLDIKHNKKLAQIC